MIKVLIVDDSDTEAEILKAMFKLGSDMEVIGRARNGKEAIELAQQLKPNLITMDIEMPFMNGFQATKLIMQQQPTPIVIISAKLKNHLDATFLALEAGALSVMDKPTDVTSPQFEKQCRSTLDMLRALAEIKVFKPYVAHKALPKTPMPSAIRKYKLLVIGASVGGPQALKTVLGPLAPNFPIPIVIVQHMTKGFIDGFAEWLDKSIPLTVKRAENFEELKPGTIYFAPDGCHLTVSKSHNKLYAHLQKGLPRHGFRPSITALFESVAKEIGRDTLAILLTGMGDDGAHGLLELKKSGAHTLIQDKKTCVVFGMAGVAQALGAAEKVLPLDQIAPYIKQSVK